jgi:hypothetical protein
MAAVAIDVWNPSMGVNGSFPPPRYQVVSPSSTLPPPTPSPSDRLLMPRAQERVSASRRSRCLRAITWNVAPG